jgi:trans-aconitate 2-methyltransferase
MAAGDAAADAWEPEQYERFKAERTRPFTDLVGLLKPRPNGKVVDLGCGTGELTRVLHEWVQAEETVGIDSSKAMLAQAVAGPGLRFEEGDIAAFRVTGLIDVVFANASLQWLPRHHELVRRLAAALRPGGQLAVQVPANADHPSHMVAVDVANEPPFVDAFDGGPPPDPVRANVLRVEQYAELLDEIGFAEQHVRLQVYGHHLDSTSDVVEWVKGTSLTRFRERLPADLYEMFLVRYADALREVLGERSPYFYAFKRILFWAKR